MSIYAVKGHMVVVLESRESQERRDKHPRARRRYEISCTCRGHRRPDGHCMHARALLEDQIRPERWRDITATPMSAPDDPESSPHYGRARS